jgi:hypothetical protein
VPESATDDRLTTHYAGFPPELTGGADQRQEMEPAAYLVIEEKSEGFFLVRYSLKGDCAGDTWHMDLDDIQNQLSHEYPGISLEWRDVPPEAPDAAEYGLEFLKKVSGRPERRKT